MNQAPPSERHPASGAALGQAVAPGLLPYALASGAACGIALLVAVRLAEPARGAALYGSGAATLAAVCALSALGAFASRGTSGVLAGFSLGFLVRMALVAIGLVASGARGPAALAYVAAFFGVYAATQFVEILYVRASARVAGQSARPGPAAPVGVK